MKNRTHRPPQSDSPDDWVDGSWTVDCSCGTNFDDGEEMVSCDECGVWVHTRCSRFVKGETSFACHNCKKNNNNNSSNSSKKPSLAAVDTEETEVAQLLIELPTKTDPCPPPNPFPVPAYRAPFRLWAEVPMEDRVHVQGIPGDPSLFQEISSSVFTSELWKCTGFVPKKFNFQYREFPCWEEDGGENPASQGADVLFSLSKEVVPSCLPTKVFDRKQDGGEKGMFGSRLQSWGKKERNKLRLFGSHSSKGRKEEELYSKKKKARSNADRVAAEFKKRGSLVVADVKKGGLADDRGAQLPETDVSASKDEVRMEEAAAEGVDSVKKVIGNDDEIVGGELERRAVSVPVADLKKAGGAEDGGVQIEELDDPSVKCAERKEESVSRKLDTPCVESEGRNEVVSSQNNSCDKVERTDSGSKQNLVIKASKGGPADKKSGLKNVSELRVKVETEDEDTGISSEADVPVASQEKHDDNIKQHVKKEDLIKAVPVLEKAKDENHPQCDLNGSTQGKPVSSGSLHKNEKTNQPAPQSSSKLVKHSLSMHAPSSSSPNNTKNDQWLALRLHQELNSSPRVPRVPRVRQASGSQTSQSAPNMPLKRSSHSGGRDQAFRRKNKGASRDESHNSQETIDELKKAGRAMSSPDRKYQESCLNTGSSTKKDLRNRSPDTIVSMKSSDASIGGENSCRLPFEASGQNALSVKSSSRDVLDDDATTHTLPGLIDEILSKQKCSTYEELCDAVSLHWQNVRKPNGERYAYSSHSHAVLDCLRNRSEWKHLIDRGPKTNTSKRRRKIDSDTPAVEELETPEVRNTASSREVEDKTGDSRLEDFPKGKRMARQRRRLEVQGSSMKEARKRKCASSSGSVVVSDDDDKDDDESAAAFSHSSNEGADGISSEEESREAIDHTVGVETSASTSPRGGR